MQIEYHEFFIKIFLSQRGLKAIDYKKQNGIVLVELHRFVFLTFLLKHSLYAQPFL